MSVVLSRLSMHRIKHSEASTLIYGLNIVGRLMTEIDQAPAEFDETQPAASSESEPSMQAIEQMVNSITADLEGPTFKEIRQLRESMPDATAEQALEHWISSGKFRPRQQADGLTPHPKHAMRCKPGEQIGIAAHASSSSAH